MTDGGLSIDEAIAKALSDVRGARFTADLEPSPEADANVVTFERTLDDLLDARAAYPAGEPSV